MTCSVYRCGHSEFPHLFRLPFDELPPDTCPRCNCKIYRLSADKVANLALRPHRLHASLSLKPAPHLDSPTY